MRPWCRILVKVSVPGISSPGAALRGVPTSSNGPCQLLKAEEKIGESRPVGIHEAEPARGASEGLWRFAIPPSEPFCCVA